MKRKCEVETYFFVVAACPGGFTGPEVFNGETSCYLYVTTGLSQADARANCQQSGADLVSIEGDDEMVFVNGEL